MFSLAEKVYTKVKEFSLADFIILKVCLGSIGMLLGALFSKSVKKLAPFLIIVSVVTYAYMVYKIFFADGDDCLDVEI